MRRSTLRTLAATIAAAACATGDGDAGTAEPIVIGMVAPLTGAASAVGSGHRAGAEAAVRELNRLGDIRGRRVVIHLADDASNPTEGLIRTQRLASDPDVVAMIGSGFPATALASASVATRLGLPYVSVAPLHTLVYPPRPYVYTTAHTTRLVVYKLAAHLRAAGVTRLALLRSNTSVGIEAGAVIRELAARYRLSLVSEVVYPPTSSTFVAELVRIKNSDAQALWVWGVGAPVVTITKEFRQLQLPQSLLLGHGAATQQYLVPACPDANGATLAAPWSVVARRLPDSNPSKRLALRVDGLVGSHAGTFAYNGYSAVMMLAQAMRTHGVGRQPINRALERMTFIGPEGVHRFTRLKHAGLSSKSLLLARITNCRLEPMPGQDLDG